MSEKTITNWDVLDSAHAALRTAVTGVPAGAWDQATPCTHWTVTQVFQHAVGDQLGYAATITGGPGPSENPFEPSGHLDDEGPLVILDRVLEASGNAWASVGADAKNVPTPLPQGAMPAWMGVGACALDAAVHAWDIAVATGTASPLTPALAKQLMAVAERLVEPLRAYGVYAPAIPADAAADDVAVLLRYLGRRPDWTP